MPHITTYLASLAKPIRLPSLLLAGLLAGIVAFGLSTQPVAAQEPAAQEPAAQEPAAQEPAALPDWLEPRGLNIVDLVGQVPEEHLRGATISYETGAGIVTYTSGRRSGSSVIVNVSIVPRYGSTFTDFGCLGQFPAYDQMPSASPASSVRIFAGGRDITSTVLRIDVIPADLVKPADGANAYPRYPRRQEIPVVQGANGVSIPANMGCHIFVDGRQTNLTATFTVNAPQVVQVTPMGSQTWQAHSLYGPSVGDARGSLRSLVEQMHARFGSRHDKFPLRVPAGADYLFLKYGPIPVDPYISIDWRLAGSGTWRLAQGVSRLTTDNVNSMGVPLSGLHQDSDQAGGDFLNYLSPLDTLSSPEYFLIPGFAYDPCMTNGGCPSSLLDRLHDATYPITAYYYKVERLANAPLQRTALRQVGKGFGAASAAPAPEESAAANGSETVLIDPAQTGGRRTFLPVIRTAVAVAPPDNPAGCPCGWFHADGRMVDFVPRP